MSEIPENWGLSGPLLSRLCDISTTKGESLIPGANPEFTSIELCFIQN
jgi:hypothetical protein